MPLVIIDNCATTTNPYPGMSLSEACADFELYTERALNEFQMNILLNEHAYLYANGHELDYVEEAVEFSELKKKFVQFVKNMIKKVEELFDAAMIRILELIKKFKAKSIYSKISHHKIDDLVKAFEIAFPDGRDYDDTLQKPFYDVDEIFDIIQNIIDKDMENHTYFEIRNLIEKSSSYSDEEIVNQLFDKAIKGQYCEYTMNSDQFKYNITEWFDFARSNASFHAIKQLRELKKDCIDYYNNLIKNIDPMTPETLAEKYSRYIKIQNRAFSKYIKLVYDAYTCELTNMSKIINDTEFKKALADIESK